MDQQVCFLRGWVGRPGTKRTRGGQQVVILASSWGVFWPHLALCGYKKTIGLFIYSRWYDFYDFAQASQSCIILSVSRPFSPEILLPLFVNILVCLDRHNDYDFVTLQCFYCSLCFSVIFRLCLWFLLNFLHMSVFNTNLNVCYIPPSEASGGMGLPPWGPPWRPHREPLDLPNLTTLT